MEDMSEIKKDIEESEDKIENPIEVKDIDKIEGIGESKEAKEDQKIEKEDE